MKNRVLVGVAANLLFFFFVFQISVLINSKFLNNAAFSETSQGIRQVKMKLTSKQIHHQPKKSRLPGQNPIICDRTHKHYDLCTVNEPTVLDPITATFFTRESAQSLSVERIRPYPRKLEKFTMVNIKDITLTSGPRSPPCKIQHKVPALVFTTGGYTGNFFHDFNDLFVPLFITANTIYPNQDFVIVVAQAPNWWLSKYEDILHMFTKHPIITLGNDRTTHCFPSANLGLITHGFMTVNKTLIPNSKTFVHFRELLDKAYRRKSRLANTRKSRPHLVLASRKNATGRTITNQAELIHLIKQVGFDVTVFEPKANTPLHESYAFLNSSHVFVGVHGAALTHSLFLRPGSVFIQVIPIGADWVSDVFFGRVAKACKLDYLKYKIGVEESSLVDKYGKDSVVVRDPSSLQKSGWSTHVMDIYLREQNVKLDLERFEGYLKRAYKKARKLLKN